MPSINDYLYNLNANMVSDANKQIMNISYTHQNLPRAITIGGDAEHRVCFLYDATGWNDKGNNTLV